MNTQPQNNLDFIEYQDRFGIPYWFSSVYKITRYEYYGNPARPMPKGEYRYQCYKPIVKQWGDFVDRSIQKRNDPLTFEQCVNICEADHQQNPPDKYLLKNAEIAKENFLS
jgi:hypothetical protein